MMDLMYIENPNTKNKKNFYINDFNYYNKSSIKMYKIKKQSYLSNFKAKELQMQINPMPKMLYSTRDFYTIQRQKKFIEKNINLVQQTKNDLENLINDFNISFDSEKNEPQKNNNQNLPENIEIYNTAIPQNTDNNFFLTKFDNFSSSPKTEYMKTLQNETKNIKLCLANEISNEKIYKSIKQNELNYKDNLQLEDFEKYKYTKTGIEFPKKLNKYDVPKYNGTNKEEEKYFNYKKTIKYPNQIYNKVSSFGQKLNKDLGTICTSYGKNSTKGRFVKNPLLSKYMEMIPIYDIYKDIKFIENRYVDKRFKYKMLPLVNNRLRNLDKLAERMYKMDHIKNGLNNLLSITSEKKASGKEVSGNLRVGRSMDNKEYNKTAEI